VHFITYSDHILIAFGSAIGTAYTAPYIRGETPKIPGVALKHLFKIVVQVSNVSHPKSTPSVTKCSDYSTAAAAAAANTV